MLLFKRLLFAYKNYKFLRNRWDIKYPFLNAFIGKRCIDINTKLYKGE